MIAFIPEFGFDARADGCLTKDKETGDGVGVEAVDLHMADLEIESILSQVTMGLRCCSHVLSHELFQDDDNAEDYLYPCKERGV